MLTTGDRGAGHRGTHETRSVPLADGRGRARLVLPSQAGAPTRAVFDGVRLDPGRPVPAGLIVVLRRRPRPEETDIAGLVDRALLRLDVRADLRPEELSGLREALGEQVEALVPLDGRVELADHDAQGEPPLAEAGLDQRLAGNLEATLGAEATRLALRALAGGPTGLTLSAVVGYALGYETVKVQVAGSWADVHEELRALAGPDRRFGRDQLTRALAALYRRGGIELSGEAVEDDGLIRAAAELVAPMLVAIADRIPEEADTWRLSAGPPIGWPLDTASTVSIAQRAELRLDTALAETWQAHPEPPRTADVVSLVVEAPGGGFQVIAERSPGARRRQADPTRLERQVKAAGLSASPAVGLGVQQADPAVVREALRLGGRPLPIGLGRAVVRPLVQTEPGPVLDTPGNGSWPDQRDADVRWYVPELRVVGAESGPPRTDDLQLRFHQAGLGPSGRSALTGELVVPLALGEPAAVRDARAAAGGTTFRPVPLDGAEATVELPFTDTDTGQTGRRLLTGTVTRAADDQLVVRVTLADQWTRLAYATLARGEPITCRVAHLVVGWDAPDDRVEQPSTLVLRSAVKLDQAAPGARVTLRSDHGWRIAVPQRAELAGIVVVPSLKLVQLRPTPFRVRRTVPQVHAVDISMPCDRFPDRFVEELADGSTRSVGCTDAFGIGAVDQRLLAEVPELRRPGLRVFRQLAQPDRFVLVPDRYVLSRRPEQPHDPAVILHAALDPDPADVRIVFDAMLQPEVDEADLLRAGAGARRLCGGATPVLDWATSLVDGTPSFHWLGLPAGSAMVSLACHDGRIRVSADLRVPDWLVMRSLLERSGIQGALVVTLADRTSLRSDLVIDLRRIRGPWPDGPVDIAPTASGYRLRNRLAQPVLVHALHNETGEIAVPVQRVVDALGEALVSGSADAPWLVAASEPIGDAPATVEEARVVIEDVAAEILVILTTRLADGGRASIDVELTLPGTGETAAVTLTDKSPAAQVTFTLPLTGAVVPTVLRWRVRPQAGAAPDADWRDHNLNASSVIAVGETTA
ncbi:hypothetical protein [Streptomyces flaveus]|uniref:Uncharacterized protein n=1 Tax=Streptomyces flaveus TaxID=66370 RepID=A0A917RFQ4_9ACTN|nr:hypothetical protein [Streptomyces flaveus]GGL05509.1 hypothetical protein GCM10010094_77870 [Streptomyces flaveus]